MLFITRSKISSANYLSLGMSFVLWVFGAKPVTYAKVFVLQTTKKTLWVDFDEIDWEFDVMNDLKSQTTTLITKFKVCDAAMRKKEVIDTIANEVMKRRLEKTTLPQKRAMLLIRLDEEDFNDKQTKMFRKIEVLTTQINMHSKELKKIRK